MTSWNNPTRWQGLLDGSDCPICVRGEPLDIITTLPASWLTMPADAAMAGYVCLVSRVHVVELHDFDDKQAAAFMADARRVSRTVQRVTGAVKLNYEMHGNILPHLHMHFFPRHPGDAFEGRAIDPRTVEGPVYSAGEFEAMRRRIQAALEAGNHQGAN
ncbi:MAG: HIT family protein [Gemmatimonadota bacterium]